MTTATDFHYPIDEAYEFSAPMTFDFSVQETEDDIRKAELWFDNAQSYAPSPFNMRIKGSRFAEGEEGICCDFGDAEKSVTKKGLGEEPDQGMNMKNNQLEATPKVKFCEDASKSVKDCKSKSVQKSCLRKTADVPAVGSEACTPKVARVSTKGAAPNSTKNQTARKKITNVEAPSNVKSSLRTAKANKPGNISKLPGSMMEKGGKPNDIAQENQAIKKQRLEGGGVRQILNVKNRVLLHKSKPEPKSIIDVVASHAEARHEDAIPYVSVAELVKKFESKTREMDVPQNRSLLQEETIQMRHMRPKLTLTRPKGPDFQTTQRARAVRVKSTAEIEEEMLAKMPKFKARPFNKKIFEAPVLPPFPRSTLKTPEFQEFNLRTTERANRHTDTASIISSSTESICQNNGKALKLTAPRPPVLQTSLRARPPRVKTSEELEAEELEKIPKFKARPLNKKILEKKADVLPSTSKSQITIPQEFHFATNERLGPPTSSSVVDLFDKLSLHSDNSERHLPRVTMPDPFNLHTEERGMEKERRFVEQVLQKQFEEERARIPKACPYPYSTDYPVIPAKPEPKRCTKPEVFPLESLARHEEEVQRMMEEKKRMEREETQRRIFRARPVMKDSDPIPLPEKERKPLTEVQAFSLHVDHRAEDRAEFDKKMKEKEMLFKRQREENDMAQKAEEEKALKQMRRTMVPHARPIPSFTNPFVPEKKAKVATRPMPPKLLVAERENRRRRRRQFIR